MRQSVATGTSAFSAWTNANLRRSPSQRRPRLYLESIVSDALDYAAVAGTIFVISKPSAASRRR
jgi:hypothetical protein